MQLLPSSIDLNFISDAFPAAKFSLWQSTDNEKFINCFVTHFDNNDDCESLWKKINNIIAIDFQEPLSSKASAWNIYLILITPSEIEKHSKYKIENDRFALRKIVLSGENYYDEDNSAVAQALQESILGIDLKLQESEAPLHPGPRDPAIYDYIMSAEFTLSLGGRISSKARQEKITEMIKHLNHEN